MREAVVTGERRMAGHIEPWRTGHKTQQLDENLMWWNFLLSPIFSRMLSYSWMSRVSSHSRWSIKSFPFAACISDLDVAVSAATLRCPPKISSVVCQGFCLYRLTGQKKRIRSGYRNLIFAFIVVNIRVIFVNNVCLCWRGKDSNQGVGCIIMSKPLRTINTTS